MANVTDNPQTVFGLGTFRARLPDGRPNCFVVYG